jgi:glutamyl-tRNA synthetase
VAWSGGEVAAESGAHKVVAGMSQHVTRLAPSPTGALHLGNARTFLVNWAIARQLGWRIVLRIEDLDSPRVKRGSATDLLKTLEWLGIDWDDGPYYQSHDLAPYREALQQLGKQGQIYPCSCTRSDILAASLSAPHLEEQELRYPGTCRPSVAHPCELSMLDHLDCGWRVRVPDGSTSVADQFADHTSCNMQRSVGDFLVATKAGTPSYQLAVVVDDARQRIDRIVRGDDLFTSIPRQLLLYDLLQLEPRPMYWHLPLVVGNDGRRLAKRHGDTRLDVYRAEGVAPERLVGLIARWSGCKADGECDAREFLDSFCIENLPRNSITFTSHDHQWLMGH